MKHSGVPKLSFLTASYNRPDYLEEAIRSVEAQTDPDWEHLVYDHSTNPRVRDVLRAARVRNPDRFFFASPEIQGPPRPALYWNILAGFARGRYLTILDDDNRKHLEFLAKMIVPLDADPEIDAVSCSWLKIDVSGFVIDACNWNLATNEQNLYKSNTVDSNAWVFRRTSIERLGFFRTDLATCEDWDLTIRLHCEGYVKHLPDALCDYREHAGGASRRRGDDAGMQADRERVRQEHFPGGPPPEWIDWKTPIQRIL